LERAERAWNGTEDASVRAAPPRLVRHRSRVHTPVTAAAAGFAPASERTLDAKCRSSYQRFACEKTRVVEEVARSDVVTAVNDNVVRKNKRKCLVIKAHRSRNSAYGNCRVKSAEPRDSSYGLRGAGVCLAVENLAVEVCHVYNITVADRHAADARTDKVRQAAASKAAATDDKDRRGTNCSLHPFLSANLAQKTGSARTCVSAPWTNICREYRESIRLVTT